MCQVREATPEDALMIAIVTVYTWKTAYSGIVPDSLIDARIQDVSKIADTIRERIVSGANYLVADIDQTVVGFCCFGSSRDEHFPDAGEVFALYVLSGFQKRGLGNALFDRSLQGLLDSGYSAVVVNCLRGNPSAGFYQKKGGAVCRVRSDLYNGMSLDEDVFLFTIS